MMRWALVAVCLWAGVGAADPGTDAGAEVTAAAARFVASLDAVQREVAVLPFRTEERFNWTYVPRKRQGITLKSLSADQRTLALDLVRSATSASGFDTLEAIRELDIVLRDDMHDYPAMRDPDMYYVTVFGDATTEGAWGLRYEGHHISLHWTFRAGVMEASTPQFLGANPHEVRVGPRKGTRVLARLEHSARDFLASLDDAQRARAVPEKDAPPDILTRWNAVAQPQAVEGIAWSELAGPQRKALVTLLEEASAVQRPGIASARLAKVRAAGLDDIRFVWLGGTGPGEGYYYRVQGPTFLFEFDNTQNGANHSHSVWRDFEGDFGRDVLQAHYRAYHRPIAGD